MGKGKKLVIKNGISGAAGLKKGKKCGGSFAACKPGAMKR